MMKKFLRRARADCWLSQPRGAGLEPVGARSALGLWETHHEVAMSEARKITDHAEIRKWAEARGALP